MIRPKWRDIVVEGAPDGGKRVNRINYEIYVLQTLRDKLRCKEVWVGREACYERLGLPQDAQALIDQLKSEMTEALTRLDRRLPRNSTVRIDPRRRHPIVVSPLDPQPEPPNLEALKTELGRRWPMTGLLDILKEADLRIGFTEAFTTALATKSLSMRLNGLQSNTQNRKSLARDRGQDIGPLQTFRIVRFISLRLQS